MALRIGLPVSSALRHDGHMEPVILQCRTPQETNPKADWTPNYFLITSLFLFPSWCSWYVNPTISLPFYCFINETSIV
jgi:hypothetical protein